MPPFVLSRRPLVAATVAAVLAVSLPLGADAATPEEESAEVPAMLATHEPLETAPAIDPGQTVDGQSVPTTVTPAEDTEPADSANTTTPTESATTTTTTNPPERAATEPITLRSADGSDPFVMIGVSSATAPKGTMSVRVHDDTGWTEWVELEFSDEHGPDDWTGEGDSRITSDPIWVEEADAYEVQGLGSDVADAAAVVVRESDEATVAVAAGATVARATANQPTINSRASWGARPYNGVPLRADELKVGYVHHTVSANGYTSSQVPGILRSIQAFHMDGNGWYDIAYNFLVDRFGKIWEGRADSVEHVIIGGHAKGFNTGSVGVAAIGNFSTTTAPSAMRESIGKVVGWKLFLHGTPATGNVHFTSFGSSLYPAGTVVWIPRVVPHQQTSATGCPGNSVMANLAHIRSTAASYQQPLGGTGTFTSRAVTINEGGEAFVADFNGDQNSDVFIYGEGTATDALYLGNDNGSVTRRSVSVNGVYEVFVGDFDGDYRDDLFFYAPGAAPDSLWLGRSTGFYGVSTSVNGAYQPIAGDYNDDDHTDIIWYAPGAASDSMWLGGTAGKFTGKAVSVGGDYQPFVADFDGDQYDDVFWYAPGAASDSIWFGDDGGAFTSRAFTIHTTYQPVTGDFNGDHRYDIVWYRPGSGMDYTWLATAGGGFTSRQTPIDGTYIPVVGDYTGGGFDDILWYAPGSTTESMWRGSSSGTFSSRSVPAVNGTYDVHPGRFGEDGLDDVVWYAPGASSDYVWLAQS